MLDAAPSFHARRVPRPAADSLTPPSGVVPLPTLLHAISDAYAAGDAPRGEQLLLEALDLQLPWDAVCAAAARGISAHYGQRSRA